MGYIKGIDISNNNGAIDFSVAKADEVEYVYLKTTEKLKAVLIEILNNLANNFDCIVCRNFQR